MSNDDFETDARLTAWVDVVDYYWHRAAVDPVDRSRLRKELLGDLAASLAEGASVDELVALDPSVFASEVASADGQPAMSLRPDPVLTEKSLVTTMLTGAGARFLAALLSVYPIGIWAMDQSGADHGQQGWIVIGLHVLAAFVSLTSALAAVWWRFRFQAPARRTLGLAGTLFAVGGLASIAPTMAFANAFNFSGSFFVVMVEIGLVVGCCSLGAWTAGRVLVRRLAPT